MSQDFPEVPTTGTTVLPPDPRVMRSIGLNHAFETAIADVVDNSIDAEASNVLVRFVRSGDRLLGVYIVDDGRGMAEEAIDLAMTVGGRREYSANDLGHFGLGLKAASLGQAKSLTVMSRSGSRAIGRRWLLDKASEGFECEVVDATFAAETLDRAWGSLSLASGTVIRWDDVKCFPASRQPHIVERFLEETLLRVRQHLGLVFQRVIEERRIEIVVDVEDVALDDAGAPFVVEPIDPFAYLRSGRPGYPKTFQVQLQGTTVPAKAHIWPGRSQLPGFRLPGGRPENFQGLFFFRNGRLLQAGGWHGVTHPERHFQLARIEIEIEDRVRDVFTMNTEKTRVEVGPEFVRALEESRADDGTTFTRFLDHAQQTFRKSQKRNRQRPRVVPPGKGFAPTLRRIISREFDYLPGEGTIDVRWANLSDETFFDVDRDERVIWLNRNYRWAVVGDGDSSLNDAPLVKALVYLLAEDLFHGAYLGSKDRDNLDLWQSILTVAAQAEAR